jgi:hypothetical protein
MGRKLRDTARVLAKQQAVSGALVPFITKLIEETHRLEVAPAIRRAEIAEERLRHMQEKVGLALKSIDWIVAQLETRPAGTVRREIETTTSGLRQTLLAAQTVPEE